ncbi:hypothetical protein CTEN210_12024 [Chaetoceros tenuissimus]|uniref:O-fucosyltransferase family protein n=1 Tax=Chaetoceros tenuissimus TaxID=426638 RepID=A0AAD3HA38_9STRA|nr:hypothetical protein CTEN210_12024 [Chaetoceros tenuissimus]
MFKLIMADVTHICSNSMTLGRRKIWVSTCFCFAVIGYFLPNIFYSFDGKNLYQPLDAPIYQRLTLKVNNTLDRLPRNSLPLKLTEKQHDRLQVRVTTEEKNEDEKFLLYWPHGGFSNQIISLQRAAHIAYASNRTLVLPPVLPHHTFKGKLKYPSYGATSPKQCEKEKQLHQLTKAAKEVDDFPSYDALFNFDSISKKTRGLKVIDMQKFSRLDYINATDFSTWCVDIYKERSYCLYGSKENLHTKIVQSIEAKCSEKQIAAIGSTFVVPTPANAKEVRNWNEIESYFNQMELSRDMLILLQTIYKKLPQNYTGAHVRITDNRSCNPKKTCEVTCTRDEHRIAFTELIKDIDAIPNTSHVLLGSGNEVSLKCFKYYSKEKYVVTTTQDIVENDPELLQMVDNIGSEKETVFLLLDQILIGIADNVRMKFAYPFDHPLKGSTYQSRIQQWHNGRKRILDAMDQISLSYDKLVTKKDAVATF